MSGPSKFVTEIDFNAAMIRLQAEIIGLREVIKILLKEEQPVRVTAENLDQVLAKIAAFRLQDGLVSIENVNPALAATLQHALDSVETVDATAPPTAM
jgi:regulator of replication initiation timing